MPGHASAPNILLIMTDQQRGDCLSIDGHPVLMTPNMDRIAGQGVRFQRAYSTCPSCIPARRSLMSGQHPARTGMVGYRENVPWETAPPLMPQTLRDAGYQTAIVGRPMHLSPFRKRYGFEQMIVSGREDNEYDDALRARGVDPRDGLYGTGVMHNDWTARPWHLDETLHHSHWTMSQALKWLERRDPTAPFFLVVSFLAPHPPLLPPAFYFERYRNQSLPPPHIGDWAQAPASGGLGDDCASPHVDLRGEALHGARAAYYGMINHVDDQIRRLLNPTRGVHQMTGGDNTVVLFTSDHGEMLGDHHMWRKSVPYEGAARVPLLVRAPQRFDLKPLSVVDEPVCLEDIMPTVLDFAGVDVPDSVEGRSLLPLMRGERPTWREFLPLEHAPTFQAMTDGAEKYIWFVKDGREQFFDLMDDPHEMRDLIDAPEAQQRIARWRGRLIDRLKGRPEGFTDGQRLIPGRPFEAALPHARGGGDS